jgi:hypothetical protein
MPPVVLGFGWCHSGIQEGCIYQRPPYQALMASRCGAAQRVLRLASHDGSIARIPLLVRSLKGGGAEAFSAYGYGGLCGDPCCIADVDLHNLKMFLAKEGICCLFLRHAPFLGNHEFWPDSVLEVNRRTYEVCLSHGAGFDALLSSLPQKLRASVNRATRSGLTVEAADLFSWDHRLEAFHRLYEARMCALDSEPFYRFDLPFLQSHRKLLGGACRLLVVRCAATDSVVAGALFLIDEEARHVHYYLSAANEYALRCQGMELLMIAAIHDFGMEGFSILHLGGGHRLDETDGLSRFKRKFASKRLEYCVSRIICDQGTYDYYRELLPLRYPSLFLIADARGETS